MLTLFAIPKPFEGHSGLIQRNAITSWLALEPRPEIILLGRETGVEEVVREFGLRWFPDLGRTEYGTPLLGDAFRKVGAEAAGPLLGYVNCDIMFTRSLLETAGRLEAERFLAIGRRTNVDLARPVSAADLRDPAVVAELAAGGSLETPMAIDYFLFPRCRELAEIPLFAVGRPGWDNWLIYHALSRRMPVIDVTAGVLALHQNHGYQHVPMRRGPAWEGPEADYNRRLAGAPDRLKFSMLDATHRYCPQRGLVPVRGGLSPLLKRLIATHPPLKWPLEILGYPWLKRERLRRRRLKKLGYPPPAGAL
jgi:hypothetical protein